MEHQNENLLPVGPPTSGNIVTRLFNGDVSLVMTYWVWGGLVYGGGFTLLNAILEANYMQVVTLPYGVFIVNSFYLIALAVGVFIWIAIWRSAGKYQGGVWGRAARVMVVIGVLVTLNVFMTATEDGELTDAVYGEQSLLINKSLPMMIDESTRLESVTLTRTEYRYRNTMIDWTAAEVNKAEFMLRMRVSIAGQICDTRDTRAALESGVIYIYTYNDAVGDHIADVTLTVDNCP